MRQERIGVTSRAREELEVKIQTHRRCQLDKEGLRHTEWKRSQEAMWGKVD